MQKNTFFFFFLCPARKLTVFEHKVLLRLFVPKRETIKRREEEIK
jgi:hypothetical protein